MFHGIPWRVWVKRRRKELDYTQETLGSRIGFSAETISHAERGIAKPSVQLVQLLSEALDVAAEEWAEFTRAARSAGGEETRGQPTTATIPSLPATPLIGRESDLARAQQALLDPQRRLVTITGLPGVGKTRLAMNLAREVAPNYQQGVVWVSLAALRDPELVLEAVAAAFGIRESSERTLQDALRSYLRRQRVLLVLDNCEQVRRIKNVIGVLLSEPGVHILATSRKSLRLRGEQRLDLLPLAMPAAAMALPPQVLMSYPAIALFVERAQETESDFKLDDTNARVITQICLALDGLPLALELAAARIRILPPAAMLTRLKDRLVWLSGGAEDLPPHQKTWREALAWSYDLLAPPHQIVFRSLGVFVSGFTLDAVTELCAALQLSSEAVLLALGDLVDWHLLHLTGEWGGDPRFGMLETIHQYAVDLLGSGAQFETLRHAHLEYYAKQAQWLSAAAKSRIDVESRMEQLAHDQDNFRAALGWGIAGDGEREAAARLAAALNRFWETAGHWREARQWLTELLAAEQLISSEIATQLRFQAGQFAYLQGDYVTAESLLEHSLASSRAQKDIETQIWSLNSLGWIAYSRADYDRASHFFDESLQLCRAIDDPLAIATLLNTLGSLYVTHDDYSRADEMLQESLQLRRAHGDQQGIARSLNVLGLVAQQRGKYEQAQRDFAESIELFRAMKDKMGLALALSNLGWIHYAQGHIQSAIDSVLAGLALAREIESAWCTTLALCYLGWLQIELGATAVAATSLEESLAMARQQDNRQAIILCQVGQARLALLAGDHTAMAAHLEAAEKLRRDHRIILAPHELLIIARLNQQLDPEQPPTDLG